MGPLHGIKVIEFAALGPCPMAAMILADLGAEVVRIERKPAPGAKPAGGHWKMRWRHWPTPRRSAPRRLISMRWIGR